MNAFTVTQTNGLQTTLSPETIQGFAAGLRGNLVAPDSPEYVAACTISRGFKVPYGRLYTIF